MLELQLVALRAELQTHNALLVASRAATTVLEAQQEEHVRLIATLRAEVATRDVLIGALVEAASAGNGGGG
eukprot:SAG11_NODE_6322_length_1337_cov_1.073506_1_plen_70_part_10